MDDPELVRLCALFEKLFEDDSLHKGVFYRFPDKRPVLSNNIVNVGGQIGVQSYNEVHMIRTGIRQSTLLPTRMVKKCESHAGQSPTQPEDVPLDTVAAYRHLARVRGTKITDVRPGSATVHYSTFPMSRFARYCR